MNTGKSLFVLEGERECLWLGGTDALDLSTRY